MRSDVVELQRETVGNAKILKHFVGQENTLHIESRVAFSNNFHSNLPEHSVTAFLRAVVTKVRLNIIKFHRLRQFLHPILQIRTHGTRGSLRFQSQTASAFIKERVHLLRNNVRVFSNTAVKNLGIFQDRSRDATKSGLSATVTHHFLNEGEKLVIFRKNIVNSLRRLKFLNLHGLGFLGLFFVCHRTDRSNNKTKV